MKVITNVLKFNIEPLLVTCVDRWKLYFIWYPIEIFICKNHVLVFNKNKIWHFLTYVFLYESECFMYLLSVPKKTFSLGTQVSPQNKVTSTEMSSHFFIYPRVNILDISRKVSYLWIMRLNFHDFRISLSSLTLFVNLPTNNILISVCYRVRWKIHSDTQGLIIWYNSFDSSFIQFTHWVMWRKY